MGRWLKTAERLVILDFVRGAESVYACSVLANPMAKVRVSTDWFPAARVCHLIDSTLRWARAAPGDAHTIPDGTLVLESD